MAITYSVAISYKNDLGWIDYDEAAKTAVVSSALMGCVSGSSIANVVTTGTFTIPLMVSSGYKKNSACAIEAVASTGGMIMPPMMGAAAFILGEYIGVSYGEVC